MIAKSNSARSAVRPAPRVAWTQAILLAAYLAVSAIAAAILLARLTLPALGGEGELKNALWTMLVGSISNATCAILGCYLVLRRMSLLGDAISHAVLPGIVLGFLASGSITGWPIFFGAMALGILTSVLAHGLTSLGRVSEDSSLGVVFTSLFAAGVILIPRNADLDANCVLFGDIVTAAVDMQSIGRWEVSRPLVTLVPTLLLVLVFVAVLWKELKIVAFDSELAAAMGFRVAIVHYLLMAMVSGVTVSSFESVGSILVVAMLIVPAATAQQLTDRLGWMMAWAVAIGTTSAVFGYLFARTTSVAGAMAVVAGIQFAAAVFLAPRTGLVSRWLRNQALAVRIASEDVLARLYRAEEQGRVPAGIPAGVPAGFRVEELPTSHRFVIDWIARWRLFRAGWIEEAGAGALQLTSDGRDAARSLIRAHRLWESYLDAHFDLPRDHLHEAAERMEHYLGAELQEELATELADRAVDPHGKIIPPKKPL